MPRHHHKSVFENGKQIGTEDVPFTSEEEAARDAEETQAAKVKADYIANEKYKDDRREAYGDIGAQLDMQYWDGVNDTTVWVDHVAKVKSDHPKP
jgi:hypothetical protein